MQYTDVYPASLSLSFSGLIRLKHRKVALNWSTSAVYVTFIAMTMAASANICLSVEYREVACGAVSTKTPANQLTATAKARRVAAPQASLCRPLPHGTALTKHEGSHYKLEAIEQKRYPISRFARQHAILDNIQLIFVLQSKTHAQMSDRKSVV